MSDGLDQNNKENVSTQQAEKTTEGSDTFSCAIVEEKGVGKTSFIMRLLTEEFVATKRFETVTSYGNYTIQFLTNHGPIKLNISIIDGRVVSYIHIALSATKDF
jgi:GTPase SAR1 family protein